MRVVFTAELNLVLENDDSAESCRHDLEKRLQQEWIGDRRDGETVTVRVKSIEADTEDDPLAGRFREFKAAQDGR